MTTLVNVRQLASAEGLSAYWRHADSHVIGSLPAEQRQKALHDAISASKHGVFGAAGTSTSSSGSSSSSSSAVVARAPAAASGVVVAPVSLRLKGTHNDDPHDAVGPKYAAHFELEGFRADIVAEQVSSHVHTLLNLYGAVSDDD
jgi:hypothetical protein